MLTVTQPDPTIPEVYCQLNEQNEVLGSLMSSVFQRSVRSQRFDRNQQRQVSLQIEHRPGGIVATHHAPLGNFQSKIAIVVISRSDLTDDVFLPHLITIATNRGHTIVAFSVSQETKWPQIKAGLGDTQKQYHDILGYQLFLCGSYEANLDLWTNLIDEPIASNIWHLAGIFWFVGARGEGEATNMTFPPQASIKVPTMIVIDKEDLCWQTLSIILNNPFVILVKLPGHQSLFPDSKSLQRWLGRCMLEFAEAECARITCSYRSTL